MSDPSAPPDELSSLAAQAERAAARQAASAAAARENQLSAGRRRARLLGWGVALWLVAAALWAWQTRSLWLDDSLAKQDLAALMEEARTQVEAVRQKQGQLPDALPSPALAVVIRYEVVDAAANPPVYRLEGTLGPARQTWTNAK